MKLGIVGSEEAKFTALGAERAKAAIRQLITPDVSAVVSGHCHLGGIDIWAEEIADELGITKEIYPPKIKAWEGGYKQRNLQIAQNSDKVVCITVDKLPPDFRGMRFDVCYHCLRAGRDGRNHVKSGGCWTVLKAKEGEWIVIAN